MTSKNKLHALLAVEGDLKSRTDSVIAESQKLFTDKQGHFIAGHRSYEPLEDGGIQYPDERQEMVTTVDAKLDYLAKNAIKSIDVSFQKECTNTVATADFVIGDKVLAKDVPSTAFLNLESNLKKLRTLYSLIPTLPPAKKWVPDAGSGPGVFLCDPEVTFKTEKRLDAKILYNATKEHPAQIEKFNKDVNVGKWTKYIRAGMWTSARKAEVLDRIDRLIRATKKGRQRANDVEVKKVKVGTEIFNFINDWK
jgi:hypothetical protein